MFDEDYKNIIGQPFHILTEEYEKRLDDKLKIQVTEFIGVDSVVEVIPLGFIG